MVEILEGMVVIACAVAGLCAWRMVRAGEVRQQRPSDAGEVERFAAIRAHMDADRRSAELVLAAARATNPHAKIGRSFNPQPFVVCNRPDGDITYLRCTRRSGHEGACRFSAMVGSVVTFDHPWLKGKR